MATNEICDVYEMNAERDGGGTGRVSFGSPLVLLTKSEIGAHRGMRERFFAVKLTRTYYEAGKTIGMSRLKFGSDGREDNAGPRNLSMKELKTVQFTDSHKRIINGTASQYGNKI